MDSKRKIDRLSDLIEEKGKWNPVRNLLPIPLVAAGKNFKEHLTDFVKGNDSKYEFCEMNHIAAMLRSKIDSEDRSKIFRAINIFGKEVKKAGYLNRNSDMLTVIKYGLANLED